MIYIQIESVYENFYLIKKQFSKDKDTTAFVDYFEKKYIKKLKENINKCELKFWNVYKAWINNMPTSNNSLKAWNAGLNKKLATVYNISKFCDVIRRYCLRSQLRLLQANQTAQNKSARERKMRILKALNNFSKYKELCFFEYAH